MAIEIKAPAFPESVADGEVAAWHKQEGEQVNQGDLLFTVETEKVDTDVEAPASGTLVSIQYEEGDEADVGEIVAYIEV